MQIVPGRHEVDEDVLVRPNAKVIVEQTRSDFERLPFRRRRRHRAAASRAEVRVIGRRRIQNRAGVRLDQLFPGEKAKVLRPDANGEERRAARHFSAAIAVTVLGRAAGAIDLERYAATQAAAVNSHWKSSMLL